MKVRQTQLVKRNYYGRLEVKVKAGMVISCNVNIDKINENDKRI